jgi:hypothetical protein
MAIPLAPSDQSLMVFSALAEKCDDAVGELAEGAASRGPASSQSMRRADATHMAIPAARFFAGCWKFNVRCWKFTDGSAVRPFASARTKRFLIRRSP